MQEYPEIVAVLILVAGIVVASLLSRAVGSLIRRTESVLRRLSPNLNLTTNISQRFVSRAVYYVTIGIAILLALSTLGLGEEVQLFDQFVGFLPELVSGIVILIAGYLISLAVYQLLSGYLSTKSNDLAPRLAQGAILVLTALTALDQMAVNVSIIGQTLIVILTLSLGGVSLAFALGAKDYVAGLMARRSLTEFSVGDRIRVLDVEGTIVEFSQAGVIVQTNEGLASVPARILTENIVIRVTSS